VGIALVLGLMYVSSVFRFILFDAVLTGECHIRSGWSNRQDAGKKFFKFSLIFLVVTLSVLTVVFGAPLLFAWSAGFFQNPSQHMGILIVGGAALFFLFLLFAIVSGVIGIFARDLLVPILALEGLSLGDAVNKVKGYISEDRGGYAVFVIMRILI